MSLVSVLTGLLYCAFFLSVLSHAAHGYDHSMSTCLAVAKMFRNTCNSATTAADSVKSIPSETVTCNDVGQCGGINAGFLCTWERRLCVTCRMDTERGGTTKIRIQSNGRPDHCYYSPAVSPRDVDIDFEVDFNTHVGTEVRLSPTTQSDIEALLCNSTTVSDAALSESSAYKRYAYNEPMKFPVAPDENLNKIVGIALNGVPYISSLDGANTDMWGGTTRERVEEPIDSCLGYVTPNGMYSYPMIPVCIHDRRDNTTTHDVAHPDNARYLCSFSDDGYEGCQNRTRHAMDEYLSLTHSSRRSEKTQYETHHSGLDYKGANTHSGLRDAK